MSLLAYFWTYSVCCSAFLYINEWLSLRTFDLGVIALRLPHEECGSFAIQRIGRVRVPKELREEDFEDIDHVIHWRPGLVDDIEADGTRAVFVSKLVNVAHKRIHIQLINVGVEYPVDEADARALVWILVWQFDVYLPETAFEGCYKGLVHYGSQGVRKGRHTFRRPLEPNIELLPTACQRLGRREMEQ